MTKRKPIVKVGEVTAPVVRTAGQGGAAWMLMELTEAYDLYQFDERQWAITLLVGTTFLAWVQNYLEKRQGRKLVGA